MIDNLLNKFTMYRTLLYSLCLLVVVTITFSFTGTLDYEPFDLIASLAILVVTGLIVNYLLSWVYKIPLNNESGLLTTLILFFLITPVLSVEKIISLVLITIIALASKFVINYRGKHIFNPAALGVCVVGLLGLSSASWWVGSNVLWVFVLVFGLLTARKIRRITLVCVFALTSFVGTVLMAMHNNQELTGAITHLATTSPLLFLGTIMLTEPATMPSKKNHQMIFAILVGILFSTHLNVAGQHIYPETALLLGNLYAFAVSPKRRWTLTYKTKVKISEELYDYEFITDAPMQFEPGQYMEWTIDTPFLKQDDRGNRRTFTVASGASEKTIHVGIRMPKSMSTYKTAWSKLKPGDKVLAGQITGSFTMPLDASKKLLFIAGGVGITPYRSMVKTLMDHNEQRDVVLIYAAKNSDEIMYQDIFDLAEQHGVKSYYISGSQPLLASDIQNYVADISDRKIYVSGPPGMVKSIKKGLKQLPVKTGRIKTDFFSGY